MLTEHVVVQRGGIGRGSRIVSSEGSWATSPVTSSVTHVTSRVTPRGVIGDVTRVARDVTRSLAGDPHPDGIWRPPDPRLPGAGDIRSGGQRTETGLVT